MVLKSARNPFIVSAKIGKVSKKGEVNCVPGGSSFSALTYEGSLT